MHGLGNDFVVIDTRARPLALTTALALRIADRREGVGCDQLVTIEPPRPEDPGSVAFMGIRNADGCVVEACGNATRCVAHLLMEEAGTDTVTIGTLAGVVVANRAGADEVRVDMGPARIGWDQIPLAEARDTLHLDVGIAPFTDAVAVSMGNPHVVAFVCDAEAQGLAVFGPSVERHALFPARVNVEIVTVREDGRLRMRVWERGSGITRACGTGACAAAVAAMRRELVPRGPVTVLLDGGPLTIDWRVADDHVLMTGPVATAFTGVLDGGLLP
ncbi:diaminopimelate epimerase [Roseospira marina]|uniref:Diaminopimelate epimerase n=2 Tax=Roseospira marina TaxID=140057 RepID=A0A5M6IDQ2_9PROT|nr:diaminopimelate epimerase [Roseospira marina]KAA5606097.1 diaminopimelate epimerase [Roseospira marina]